MAPSGRKRTAAAPSATRGRGRPVDHDGRETRAEILGAALQLFGEAGYRDVSMEVIAAACGVNVRALYHHFASKRVLFESAREEAFGRLVREIHAHVLSQVTMRDRVDGYVEVYRSVHASDPFLLRFIGMALVDGMALTAHQGSLSQAGAELLRLLEVMIDDAIAAGEVDPDLDRDGAIHLFSAISIGIALMSLGDPVAFPAMLDALDLLTAGTLLAPDGEADA